MGQPQLGFVCVVEWSGFSVTTERMTLQQCSLLSAFRFPRCSPTRSFFWLSFLQLQFTSMTQFSPSILPFRLVASFPRQERLPSMNVIWSDFLFVGPPPAMSGPLRKRQEYRTLYERRLRSLEVPTRGFGGVQSYHPHDPGSNAIRAGVHELPW